MLGISRSVMGLSSNVDFRNFFRTLYSTETDRERQMRPFNGGEGSRISRQFSGAYVHKTVKTVHA